MQHFLLWLIAIAQAIFSYELHGYGQTVLNAAETILQEQLGMLVMILAAIGGLGSGVTFVLAVIVAMNAPARIRFPKE